MVAISFSVRALSQLCILSTTDLGISKANQWREIYVVNGFMSCSIWSFNKCKYDKFTILSPIYSTMDFLKPFMSSNNFELSLDNTLLAATTVCNSASTYLIFWPSTTVAWALRSCMAWFALSSSNFISARLFSNSKFYLSNFASRSLFLFCNSMTILSLRE